MFCLLWFVFVLLLLLLLYNNVDFIPRWNISRQNLFWHDRIDWVGLMDEAETYFFRCRAIFNVFGRQRPFFSLSLFFFFFFLVASEWVGVLSPLTFANPLLRNSIGWFCCRVERQVVAKQTGRCTPLYLRVCKVSGGTSLWTACRSCRLQWCTRTSAFPARRLFLPTYPCTASVFWYFYTAVHPCSWLGIEYQLLTYNSYSLPGCIVHPWPHLSIRRIIPFRIIFLREETPTKICGRCW